MAQLSDRLNSFQNPGSSDFHKLRQQKYAVELRRTKRTSNQNKKRLLQTGNLIISTEGSPQFIILANIHPQVHSFSPTLQNTSLSDLQKLYILRNLLISDIPDHIAFYILQTIRLSLQGYQEPPIGILNGLKYAQAILKYTNLQIYHPKLVDLSCVILSTFASGNHQYAYQIVALGGIPKLLVLVSTKNLQISKNALHALSNLSGDCNDFREILLSHNFLKIIKNFIDTLFDPDLSLLRVLAWSLSNIARAANNMGIAQIIGTIEMIKNILARQDKDEEVLGESI